MAPFQDQIYKLAGIKGNNAEILAVDGDGYVKQGCLHFSLLISTIANTPQVDIWRFASVGSVIRVPEQLAVRSANLARQILCSEFRAQRTQRVQRASPQARRVNCVCLLIRDW